MRKLWFLLFCIALIFSFVILSHYTIPLPFQNKSTPAVLSEQTKIPVSVQGIVTKVVDGDTLRVKIQGKSQTIRLIGINTPETVDPRRPVQCFGKEASAKAKAELTGKTVFLESDTSQDDRDKYGRLLRYIWLADGTNFNEQMILEGYAYEYTYDLPYKYQKEFKRAQIQAQSANRGLWAKNTCNGEK